MGRLPLFCMAGLAACLLALPAFAGGHNPADYPLRVHVFQFNSHSHYYHQALDVVDGEGRANLYENGQPRGFDFSYRCSDRLRTSAGYETYLARWKKQDRTLEILLPQFGKPGAMEACELKVEMKDSMAYYKHNGLVNEEPAAAFKQWMDRRQYDPEHGMNEPVKAAGAAGATAAPQPE